jgi:hypothetical protein
MDKSKMRLFYQGHTLELSPEAAVIWAIGTMISPLDLVGVVHWAQFFSMPGRAVGYYLRIIDKAVEQLKENATVVDDTRILQAINEVLPPLVAFTTAARDIHEWQDSHVPKKIRTAHNKGTREHGPQEPPWHDNEKFTTKLDKSSSAFSLYLDALSRTIPMIREFLPQDAPTSLSEQLDRSLKQIPDFQMILRLGYREAF